MLPSNTALMTIASSGTYEVADQSGRIVKRGNLGRKTDQVVLDTFDLIPGNYYISLISASKNVASTRFVISK
jgi:Flp pilus assembly protein TadB